MSRSTSPLGAEPRRAFLGLPARKLRCRTISISLSGGICGPIWWPVGALCGKPLSVRDVRGAWGFWQKGDTFREALLRLQCREGGDFQNASFTADTVLRIERRSIEGAGKYTVHIWEREVSALPDCADLVNQEAFTGDFMGDCE